ncbi:MAG: glycerate kinase [Archangium sp.]
MRVLVAPQEFKGTMTAREAATVLAKRFDGHDVELFPLADGGPGTLELVSSRVEGTRVRESQVKDPLGREVTARWCELNGGEVALIEMAEAAGLWRVDASERDAMKASTFGVGQLIVDALDAGCSRIVVTVGGSATTDGGVGAAEALGVRFSDEAVDLRGRAHRLERVQLEVWTDVRNPLLGADGAARTYAKQKGASADQIDQLEARLTKLTRLHGGGSHLRPGAGAAGGLAWGLEAFCGATLAPGFLKLAELTRLEDSIRNADLVVTGEGRLDSQSTFEKGPWALAQLARRHGKRVVAIVGENTLDEATWRQRFDDVALLTTAPAGSELHLIHRGPRGPV